MVRREGSKVVEEEVARWLEGRVSRFKRLSGGVVFVEGVPKNPVRFESSCFVFGRE